MLLEAMIVRLLRPLLAPSWKIPRLVGGGVDDAAVVSAAGDDAAAVVDAVARGKAIAAHAVHVAVAVAAVLAQIAASVEAAAVTAVAADEIAASVVAEAPAVAATLAVATCCVSSVLLPLHSTASAAAKAPPFGYFHNGLEMRRRPPLAALPQRDASSLGVVAAFAHFVVAALA